MQTSPCLPENNDQAIEKIRFLMQKYSLNQYKLAKRTGIGRNTISKWLGGEHHRISLANYLKLLKAFPGE